MDTERSGAQPTDSDSPGAAPTGLHRLVIPALLLVFLIAWLFVLLLMLPAPAAAHLFHDGRIPDDSGARPAVPFEQHCGAGEDRRLPTTRRTA